VRVAYDFFSVAVITIVIISLRLAVFVFSSDSHSYDHFRSLDDVHILSLNRQFDAASKIAFYEIYILMVYILFFNFAKLYVIHVIHRRTDGRITVYSNVYAIGLRLTRAESKTLINYVVLIDNLSYNTLYNKSIESNRLTSSPHCWQSTVKSF